jgi:hypothetical protein
VLEFGRVLFEEILGVFQNKSLEAAARNVRESFLGVLLSGFLQGLSSNLQSFSPDNPTFSKVFEAISYLSDQFVPFIKEFPIQSLLPELSSILYAQHDVESSLDSFDSLQSLTLKPVFLIEEFPVESKTDSSEKFKLADLEMKRTLRIYNAKESVTKFYTDRRFAVLQSLSELQKVRGNIFAYFMLSC